MQQKKTILVTGATGAQGGSVARALLAEGKYRVRGLTRKPGSAAAKALKSAGAEIMYGDFNDFSSLTRAMVGVYGVFGVTSFWEHFDDEYRLGKNLVDAVHQSGIRHFVFSSQEDYEKRSQGRYPVPHHRMKAVLEEYTRMLGLPASFVHMSFYYENFLQLFPPVRGEDRNYYFGFPYGDARLPAASVEDLGGVVKALFNNPEKYMGRTIRVVGADHTPAQYAAVMSELLRKNISYNHVPREVFASYDFRGAATLANMFEAERVSLPDSKMDLLYCYLLHPAMQGFEQWVKANQDRFIAHFNTQFQAMII